MNLARREALDRDRTSASLSATTANATPLVQVRKNIVRIGRPGYKITKLRDPVTGAFGLLFQVELPEIGLDVKPMYRFMSAYEQKIEMPQDPKFQYLLVAAEPYETCGFKLEAEREVDLKRVWNYWDVDGKVYYVQIMFKG